MNTETQNIDWKPVTSSQLQAIAFQGGKLFIRFQGKGSVYEYEHSSEEEFKRFLEAPSAGSFFNKEIKNNHRRPFKKLS